ncbi:MAG: hypothetical protein CSA32_04285 [Desulfobulbus propionicus]|nr:MAG: hypothetical protein CSA32_04285 [Desulfobulbus propionicus]
MKPLALLSSVFAAVCLIFFYGCAPSFAPPAPNDGEQALSPDSGQDEKDLQCSSFYFLWGSYAEFHFQLEEALAAYEKALICDPAASHIVRKKALLLIRMERLDEAVHWMLKHLDSDDNDLSLRMLYADLLVTLKKHDEAIVQYQAIHRAVPTDPAPLLRLADLYFSRHTPQKAEAVLHKVLRLDKENYSALLLFARHYAAQDQIDLAAEYYRKAIALDWSEDVLLELASLFAREKLYARAEEVCREILRHVDDSIDARVALFRIYQESGQVDQAVYELNYLREESSSPHRLDMVKARVLLLARRFDEALQVLEGIQPDTMTSEELYLLAQLFYQQQRYNEAVETLQLLENDGEFFQEALFLHVNILQAQEKPDEAAALLERSISIPGAATPEMYLVLAALSETRTSERVRTVLEQGIRQFPENVPLLYEYGITMEIQGDTEEAMAVMHRVLAIDPEYAAALNFIGYTWADRNINLDKALAYIQKAVTLEPESGYIRDSLGWVYYKLGRYEEAVTELKKAVKLSADDPAIYDHLGDSLCKAGQGQKAASAYQRAAELYDQGSDEQLAVMKKKARAESKGSQGQ